jgi:large subunit ribosomal protein L6
VQASIDPSGVLTVRGPKGTLNRALRPDMRVLIQDGQITVERPSDKKEHKSLHGLTRTLAANMVQGVTEGFRKTLDVYGMGFRVVQQGEKLSMQLGFSEGVEVNPPPGIKLTTESFTPTADNNYMTSRIVVDGIDRELVGQFAAKIRAVKKPEPYKGKGIRYTDEVVRRKVGKAAKAAGR